VVYGMFYPHYTVIWQKNIPRPDNLHPPSASEVACSCLRQVPWTDRALFLEKNVPRMDHDFLSLLSFLPPYTTTFGGCVPIFKCWWLCMVCYYWVYHALRYVQANWMFTYRNHFFVKVDAGLSLASDAGPPISIVSRRGLRLFVYLKLVFLA
jgi:hypothetical protein